MENTYSGYDDLMSVLGQGRRDSVTGDRRRFRQSEADEVELFVTSEDRAREAKLREAEGDPRDRRKSGNIRPPEESVYFRFSDKTKVRNYTEEERATFREGCRRVIVHDYSERDFYHLTDEERERNDQLSKLNLRLGNLKRIYRSVDQYIVAMRVVYEAWSTLADQNLLHTRDEFFDYVSKGIIVSNRIITPKLKGIDNYNKDLILRYIADPDLDPKDLRPKPIEEPDDYFYVDAEEQRLEMDRLLNPDEIEHILTFNEKDREGEVFTARPIKRKYLKAYDDRQSLRRKNKKKKLSKQDRDLQPDIVAMLKKIVKSDASRDPYGSMYSFNSMADIFDNSRHTSIWDKAPYRGSWQDDDMAELYDLAISEAQMHEHIPGDPNLTFGDRLNASFYRKLEANGVNTVALRRANNNRDAKYLEEKKRRSRKQNRKMENTVIDRIGRLHAKPEFKKLVKRSEKALEEYRSEKRDEEDYPT